MTQESARVTSPWEQARLSAGRLGRNDIVVAGDPGAGAALISNIVYELGFGYLDPYIENPGEQDTEQSAPGRLAYYRERLRATGTDGPAAQDRPAGDSRRPRRFIKTHFYPEVFAASKVTAAVLLVRDPRDTIYSSYKWFSSFGGSWVPDGSEPSTELSYADFLDRVRIGDGERSIPGWARFYRSWLDVAPDFSKFAVVRFEDLKARPVGALTAMLAALGLAVAPELIVQAAERSTFDAMRAREDKVSAGEGEATKHARIMRRGQVGEWREWITQDGMAERFAHPDLIATAARFGYDIRPEP